MAMRKGYKMSKKARENISKGRRRTEANKRAAKRQAEEALSTVGLKRSSSAPYPQLKQGLSWIGMTERDQEVLETLRQEHIPVQAVAVSFAQRHAALTQEYVKQLRTLVEEVSLQLLGKTSEGLR